jgi:hypothetical protein
MTYWQMPLWAWFIAILVFSYAMNVILERLDLIRSQLDDIAIRLPDAANPNFSQASAWKASPGEPDPKQPREMAH